MVDMATLLKLELEKLFRAKSFYLSFVVLTAFVALMLWGFYTYAARKTGGQAVEQFKYTYESKQYFNGLTFALYSVLFSFTLLLPIFVSMSAASPGVISVFFRNDHYPSEETYLEAIAEAMRPE